jgi:hypothetical protein
VGIDRVGVAAWASSIPLSGQTAIVRRLVFLFRCLRPGASGEPTPSRADGFAVLGEQPERGLRLVAALGDHLPEERLLLLQPVIALLAHKDAEHGSPGDRALGRQVRRLAAMPFPRGDHQPAAGRSTRTASRNSPPLSGTSCRASIHMTASAVLPGRDVSAASATTNDARERATKAAARQRRLGDRRGREVDPRQAGAGHAREPQAGPATTTAQVDQVIAWPEPQLGKDTIKALERDHRERLHARRKRAEHLIEQLVHPCRLGNLGEQFVEHSRRQRTIIVRHGSPPFTRGKPTTISTGRAAPCTARRRAAETAPRTGRS